MVDRVVEDDWWSRRFPHDVLMGTSRTITVIPPRDTFHVRNVMKELGYLNFK